MNSFSSQNTPRVVVSIKNVRLFKVPSSIIKSLNILISFEDQKLISARSTKFCMVPSGNVEFIFNTCESFLESVWMRQLNIKCSYNDSNVVGEAAKTFSNSNCSMSSKVSITNAASEVVGEIQFSFVREGDSFDDDGCSESETESACNSPLPVAIKAENTHSRCLVIQYFLLFHSFINYVHRSTMLPRTLPAQMLINADNQERDFFDDDASEDGDQILVTPEQKGFKVFDSCDADYLDAKSKETQNDFLDDDASEDGSLSPIATSPLLPSNTSLKR